MNYIFKNIINDDFKNLLIKIQMLINKDSYKYFNDFIDIILNDYYFSYNDVNDYSNFIFNKIKKNFDNTFISFYNIDIDLNDIYYINKYCPWLNNNKQSCNYYITKNTISDIIKLLLFYFKLYKELNVFYYFNNIFFDDKFFKSFKKIYYYFLIFNFTKINFQSYLLWIINNNSNNFNNINPFDCFYQLFNNFKFNNIIFIMKNIYKELNLIIPKSLQNNIFKDNIIIDNINKIMINNIKFDIRLELILNNISNNIKVNYNIYQFDLLKKYYSLEYIINNTLDYNIYSPIIINYNNNNDFNNNDFDNYNNFNNNNIF